MINEIFDVSDSLLRDRGILFHETRKYSLHNRNRLLLSERQRDPFYFVDRESYDQFWLDCAIAAGANVIQAERATRVEPDAGLVQTTGGRTYQGNALIGADGVLSRVKTAVTKNSKDGPNPSNGIAVAMVAHIPDREREAAPELHFGYLPWGYAWSFPSPVYRNYGMLTLRTKGGKELREAFNKFLQSCAGVDNSRAFIRSRLLPYGCFGEFVGMGRTLLVGDACGLADPFLGEGIFYAHRSGQLAAEAILLAGHSGGSPVSRYAHSLRNSIIYELQFASAWQQILYRLFRLGEYRLLGLVMGWFHRPIEAVVQGRRSFNWCHRHNRALPEASI